MTLGGVRFFPLALAAALAALTLWLDHTVRRETPPHPALRRHDPDLVVENFGLTRYDADGQVAAVLAAAKMVHFPDDDSTELLAPRIVQHRPGEPRLTASAHRGRLSADGEELFLEDDVLLVREDPEPGSEMRIRTDFLHVVQAKSLVRTDREVLITDRWRRLSARGMEYHNDSRQLFLRERVHGRFEPSPKGRGDP
jgi:lipopolysaccharide export system protein LptC